MKITVLNVDENVYPYIEKLLDKEVYQEENDIKEKWLYLILKWLFENKEKFVNVLGIVEELYEFFGYPEEMTSFVRYMPSDAEGLGSLELNRRRLFNNWKRYLLEFEKNRD